MSSLVGKPVEPKTIDQDMMTIVGQGRFATATYSMTEKNGEQGLQVQAEQKSYAPPIVRPLILIDGSEYNNVLFSIGARITFLDVGSYRLRVAQPTLSWDRNILRPASTTIHSQLPAIGLLHPEADSTATSSTSIPGNTILASYRYTSGSRRSRYRI